MPRAKRQRCDSGNPQNRLMVGGEIKRDAGAERDRHPRQQAPGAGLSANPFAEDFAKGGHDAQSPDGASPPARAAARGGQVPA